MSVINDALKKAKEESQKNQILRTTKLLDPVHPKAPEEKAHPPQKRKVIILTVLSFVLFGILILPLVSQKLNKIATPPVPKNETTSLTQVIALKADSLTQKAEEKSKVRQPIEAASAPSITPSPSSGITLNGIMYSAKNPVAVINDELLTEGEKIGDVKVIEIRRNSVDIEKAGSLITLSLTRK